MPTNPQTTPPGTTVPPAPPAPPPVVSSPPATNPNPTSPGRGTAAPPQDNDQQLIREVLRTYEAAYTSLNAEAVQRIYPSVNVGALKRSFSDLRAQTVKIDSEQIQVSGDEATVTCQIARSLSPRNSSTIHNVRPSTIRLRKQGGRWVIVGQS